MYLAGVPQSPSRNSMKDGGPLTFLPLYFQLGVESAALLMTPFQHLEAPLDLRQTLLCRMKGSLSLLELMLLLAQLLLLLQQLIDT